MIPEQLNLPKNVCLLLLILFYFTASCIDYKNELKVENIKKGEALFTSVGCAVCHSLSGKSKLYGPSLNFDLETTITVVRGSKEHTLEVNRDYIKRSIINPDYEKQIPFKSNKMPIPTLTNSEIDCLVDYLIAINSK